nr:amidohydrolase [Microvirga sp. VF16]
MSIRNSDIICRLVDSHAEEYVSLADTIFDTPELLFQEVHSCAFHTSQLEAAGARVEKGVAGLPTAIIGEWGEGGPVIAILGEYDALPDLGQEPGVTKFQPKGKAGHACGHNLLGAASMQAAHAVADWLRETGTEGRVRYYGCPAEEGGAGKTFMVRHGLFDDVDAAISWHPYDYTGVWEATDLANTRVQFSFTGRASHAAINPELGRSGLDAVELMSVGVNYLREHIPEGARLHYAYIDAGGRAANVVQSCASVEHVIRTRRNSDLASLVERVRKIAQGAALMTETSLTERIVSAVSCLLGNPALDKLMDRNIVRLGPPDFDAADHAFAAEIQATLTDEHIISTFRRAGRAPDKSLALANFVVPLGSAPLAPTGSTDVGDVSWVVPTVQAYVATCAVGTPLHSWQMTAQGKIPYAHKGMIHAAKIMAATARDLFEQPELLAEAKEIHVKSLQLEPYICPIPDSINPPLP